MRVAVICSRVRVEEKLLIAALEGQNVDVERVDPRRLHIDLAGDALGHYDAALVRCLSHTRAHYVTRWLKSVGVPALSPHGTVRICGDKLLTSIALEKANVPSPRTKLAFTPDAALEAIDAGVKLLVLIPDRVPIFDVMEIVEAARRENAQFVGPNTLGVLSPGKGVLGMIGGRAASARAWFKEGLLALSPAQAVLPLPWLTT